MSWWFISGNKPTGCIWRCFTQQQDKKGQGHTICILLLHIWPKCNHEKAFLHELWPVSASVRVFNQGTWFYDYRPDVERLATNRKNSASVILCMLKLYEQTQYPASGCSMTLSIYVCRVSSTSNYITVFHPNTELLVVLRALTIPLCVFYVLTTYQLPSRINSPHTYTPALLSVLSAGLLPVSSAVSQSVPAL